MFQLNRPLSTENIDGDFSTSKNCQIMPYDGDDSEAPFDLRVAESEREG